MKFLLNICLLASCSALLITACHKENKSTPTVVIPDDSKEKIYRDDSLATPWKETGMESKTYITNGYVQIGVDLSRGGGIFHFSESGTRKNLLNHADEGRFIQQSYYGDADGSTWGNSAWTWNPIQGGGSDGTKAKVIRSIITKSRIYVETEPVSWGAVNGSCPAVPYCTMIEDITLRNNYAILKFTFVYKGTHVHQARSQEVPALFCDFALNRYVYYEGADRWQNKKLTYINPKILQGISNPNPVSERDENWSAYVNANDWGIGLYTPETMSAVYYRAGSGSDSGPASGNCSYFAPIRNFSINPDDSPYTYTAFLTIGKIDNIRKTFYKIHDLIYN